MSKGIKLGKRLEKTIEDVMLVAGQLTSKGWAERNAGNISLDVTAQLRLASSGFKSYSFTRDAVVPACLAGRCLLVSVTGSHMRHLALKPAENVSIVRLEKNGYRVLWGKGVGGDFPPTSEFNSHLAIHKLLRERKSDKLAVLHTHPNELIALTHMPEFSDGKNCNKLNGLLWSMHPEAKIVIPQGVGMVPYHLPGSQEMARDTAAVFRRHEIALWEKHGCVAVGEDVDAAFDLIDCLNKSAALYLLCRSAGFKPRGLSKAQLSRLADFRK